MSGQTPGEHPKAPELRQVGRVFVGLALLASVLAGVVTGAVEGFLFLLGLMSVALGASVFLVDSMGALPSGSAPTRARHSLVVLISIGVVLGLIALVLQGAHDSATVPAVAALISAVSAGLISARLLTK
jgi:hypothetical protein